MTKVRVCVGLSKEGNYYAFGDSDMSDKELEAEITDMAWRPSADVSFSFHDLEVDSPQAPPAAFNRGDLVEWDSQGKDHLWRVHEVEDEETVICTCCKEAEVPEGVDWRGLEQRFPGGCADKYVASWPDRFLLIAKAGQWHIANGEVVLTPPPQPKAEVPTEFQFGDLVKEWYSGTECAVAHPSIRAWKQKGVSVVIAKDFNKLSGKPHTYEELLDLFGYKHSSPNDEVDGMSPDHLTLIAPAGQWHIKDGTVVLGPEPEPEEWVPEFGDLIRAEGGKYSVVTCTDKDYGHLNADYVDVEVFHKISGPTTYTQLKQLGFVRGTFNGWGVNHLTLVAKAGQWHISSSGVVVLKPKSEVAKPKFKRGDKVTRMQLGKLETWQVVNPKPDADGMIVLLCEGLHLPWFNSWTDLVKYFPQSKCGIAYRMSYEDDCTLVPVVTTPQPYPSFRVGDMVVDQSNELWDVDEVSVLNTWVTSKNLVGRKKVPTSTLKKVVFGTL